MKIEPINYHRLIPRQTVIITTVNEEGVSNASPVSFSSPITNDPPLFGFSCKSTHDTWRNIRNNGEFIVNLVGENLGPYLAIFEEDLPYGYSEIQKAGVSYHWGEKINAPKLDDAYGWLECKLTEYMPLKDRIWIMGEVLYADVKRSVYNKIINIEKAKPLLHIYGKCFSKCSKIIKIEVSDRD